MQLSALVKRLPYAITYFFLLLLDNFFFNLVREKNVVFYFIDSIKPDRLGVGFSTLNLIAEFLNNLDVESIKIKCEERTFVIQPDSASCGICLRMVVRMICDKLANDAKVVNLLRSEDMTTF